MQMLNTFVTRIEKSQIDIKNAAEIVKLVEDIIKPTKKEYWKYHDKKAKEFQGDCNLNKLLNLRLWCDDFNACVYNLCAVDVFPKFDIYKFRMAAVGKLFLRSLVATDENIALLKNGYGISVIPNLRLILESYSIAKYLMDCDDAESEKFQDYARIQEAKINKKNPKEIFQDKYDESFYKTNEYSWISNKDIKTAKDLIDNLNDRDMTDFYKFCCEYAHSSPYSVQKLIQMNHNNAEYLPLPLEYMIQQNSIFLCKFIELECTFIEEETIQKIYNMVAAIITEEANLTENR